VNDKEIDAELAALKRRLAAEKKGP
jgi:hypothetical protein